MRILMATSQRGVVGGLESYLHAVAPALIGSGHEVGLCFEFPAGEGKQAILADPEAARSWRLDAADPASVLRDLRAWSPDVVYLHGLRDVAWEERLVNAFPTFCFAHGYQGTCISGTKRHAFPVPQPCHRVFGPLCLLLYLPRRCGGVHPGTMLRLYREQNQRLRLLRGAAGVLVASQHMRREYRRHGVAAERLHVAALFPPGIDPDHAPPRRRPQSQRLLYCGRLTAVKGVVYLAAAVRRAARRLGRPLTLAVAGDGPERQAIERSMHRLGVRVEFHGWVDPRTRTALMREADLLAVPSLWPEPFALVGVEAACVGLPAVAYAVGGIPDWLHAGESGELASGERPSVSGLADAIVRALADEDRWHRLRQGAWQTAHEFTLGAHLDRLEAVFATIPAGPGSCAPACLPQSP
jgi:glycosyltransferase involved in cell wall biosynthesis